MKILVGLGNPGKEHKLNRHNLGFLVIDWLAEYLNVSLDKKKFDCFYYQSEDIILLKPQSFMNNSGNSILSFMKFFKVKSDKVLIIYDDIYLPLGKIRYRSNCSGGSHNGIKSLINLLGNEGSKLNHLKIGVDYDKNFLIKDWVLKNFSKEELNKISKRKKIIIESLIKLVSEWNIENISNSFNKS